MKQQLIERKALLTMLVVMLLAFIVNSAVAQTTNSAIYENVLDRYQTASRGWSTIILTHASRLFWMLALISMVWTFGMMALRRADLGEFFAEFVRFVISQVFFGGSL